MNVRPGVRADWDFVEGLGSRVAATSRVRGASDEALETGVRRLLDVVSSQSHLLFIAEDVGRPVGFLILLDALPDEVSLQEQGFIAYMGVEPAFEGHGAGTALLIAAEDEARRHRLPYISLMVTESNARAMRLYERAGYRTERRLLCKRL